MEAEKVTGESSHDPSAQLSVVPFIHRKKIPQATTDEGQSDKLFLEEVQCLQELVQSNNNEYA